MGNNFILSLLNNKQKPHILVIGDIILDEYVEGSVNRISPEGPFPVMNYKSSEYQLGGAANVAANIKGLGANVDLIGAIGEDRGADIIRNLLGDQGISNQFLFKSSNRPTTTKTRYGSKGHQILRLDRETTELFDITWLEWIEDNLAIIQPDAIVISDYDKGTISSNNIPQAILRYSKLNEIGCYVDTKIIDISVFKGATLLKPNKLELDNVTQKYNISNLEDKIIQYMSLAKCHVVMASLGEDGLLLYDGEKYYHSKAKAQSVYDVTGAGDTVLAATVVAKQMGASWQEVADFANLAASFAVSHYGTTIVNIKEMV